MTCNLCDCRTLINEARDQGAETWIAEQEPYGFNLFVIPKGEAQDFRLRRDDTYGPQRKAWFNKIPKKCECDQRVKLKHEESTWKPVATALALEEEPLVEDEPIEPKRLRNQGEKVVSLSLL